MKPYRPFHESLYRFGEAQPSYWEATAGLKVAGEGPLAGDEKAEVAILGGGYTGLSAALHLARDFGIEARVLEAGHLGWGASGRNGGFCSVGGTKMPVARQLKLHGAEETRRYYRSQVEAVELVRDLGESEGIDFRPQGNGEFNVAHKPSAFAKLEKEAEICRDLLGLEAALLSRREFREVGYDGPEQFGALRTRPTFGLHPLHYALGLAEAAHRRGAKLHPQSEVLDWTKNGSDHLLSTAGGTLRARNVIVACNGFMPEHLHRSLQGRIMAAQTCIVVTRPLSDAELNAQGWRTENPVIDARHVFHYYRLLPDRRFLIGSRADSSGTPVGADRCYDDLRQCIARRWPAWAAAEIDYRWRGLVCFNSDFRPAIGRFPDDTSVSFGFGYQGNGVNTATWAGRELARWLAENNDPEAVTPVRLPALVRGFAPRFPLAFLRPAYLRAGVTWRRMRDLM